MTLCFEHLNRNHRDASMEKYLFLFWWRSRCLVLGWRTPLMLLWWRSRFLLKLETHIQMHRVDKILLHALWMKDSVVTQMMKIHLPVLLRELNQQTALMQPQPPLTAMKTCRMGCLDLWVESMLPFVAACCFVSLFFILWCIAQLLD